MSVYLIDDGTLDTVFHCMACGEEIRYSPDVFRRTDHGFLVDEAEVYRMVEDEHECSAEEAI